MVFPDARTRCARLIGWLFLAAVVSAQITHAEANGRKGAKRQYRGEAAGVFFSAELEPILFQLHTVENRYRVIRIRIENKGAASLSLSRQQDKVTVLVETREVDGVLDLGSRDAAMWDRFDKTLRTYLAYPTDVPPREEDSVFVFLPADQVKTAPVSLQFTVAALGKPVVLRPPAAAAD